MNANLAYNDEFCEELINGRLVAMSPAVSNHNQVATNLVGIFWPYLKGKNVRRLGTAKRFI